MDQKQQLLKPLNKRELYIPDTVEYIAAGINSDVDIRHNDLMLLRLLLIPIYCGVDQLLQG
jgi:hypothetical protein